MSDPTRPTITTLNALAQRYQDDVYTLAYYLIGVEAQAVKATEAAFERIYRPDLQADHFYLEVLREVLRCAREQPADDRQATGGLTDRILGLTKDEQAAIVLIDVLGLSYEQACWVVGCNQKQLAKHLSQARLHFSKQPGGKLATD